MFGAERSATRQVGHAAKPPHGGRVARARVPARAGLLGNPSDVYGGRTIALAVEVFGAEVEAVESAELRILPTDADHDRFGGLDDLVADVRANGYYGGVRLVKAALKRLAEHCAANGLEPAARNFTISYSTTIPRGVGLGGSSAIVTAVLRAATEMLGVEIPKPLLPSLALEVETEELGIAAGLQDRVSQL
jgi:glucuronokinase